MKVFKSLAIGLAISLVALVPTAHSGLGASGNYTVTCYTLGSQNVQWIRHASTQHGANQLAKSCQGIAVIAYDDGQHQ